MARVLVADDDALTRRFIEETLAFAGHQVSAVANGSAAIASVDAPGCFDAVITDYAMPHANGVDVVAHAQRIDPMIPCIVVTAFRELDLAMQAMQAGAVAFVPKPFTALHLLTRARSRARAPRARRRGGATSIPRTDARAIHDGAGQRARVQGLRDAGALARASSACPTRSRYISGSRTRPEASSGSVPASTTSAKWPSRKRCCASPVR